MSLHDDYTRHPQREGEKEKADRTRNSARTDLFITFALYCGINLTRGVCVQIEGTKREPSRQFPPLH